LEHFESHVISLEKKFTSKNFASVIISLGHFESHVIFLEKKFMLNVVHIENKIYPSLTCTALGLSELARISSSSSLLRK
jgi:predicted nucleic-acid-binding Zn-ribbon protein